MSHRVSYHGIIEEINKVIEQLRRMPDDTMAVESINTLVNVRDQLMHECENGNGKGFILYLPR